jgi:ABC-2 type transport system permease protein
MLSQLTPYFRVWRKLTIQQFQSQISNARGAAILFILGKLFRLGTAFLFVYLVVGRAKLISGYNLEQAILILALFNFFSTLTQLFMRGIYIFRQKVVDGTFDFYLLNPLSELFYSLFSYTDPMDLLLVLPYGGIVIWAWLGAGYSLTFFPLLGLIIALFIAFIMAISWHIIILGIGIRYLEVDNTIMLYRDLERLAAMPVSIYGKWGSGILTYLFPFGLMATVPANIIFGLTNPYMLSLFAILALLQLKVALWYWQKSLLTYSSASS